MMSTIDRDNVLATFFCFNNWLVTVPGWGIFFPLSWCSKDSTRQCYYILLYPQLKTVHSTKINWRVPVPIFIPSNVTSTAVQNATGGREKGNRTTLSCRRDIILKGEQDDWVERSRSLRERRYISLYHSQPTVLFLKSSKDGHMMLHQQHLHPSVMFSKCRNTDRLGFSDHLILWGVSKSVCKYFWQKVPMKRSSCL